MLRLTLRARDDGRFLARIIERDGFAFVLDYGESSMVADASERIARGFSIWREGKLETVSASSPDLLPLLAEFYSQEGLDVTLEEPKLSLPGEPKANKTSPANTITDFRQAPDLSAILDDTSREEDDFQDDETELVSYDDLPDIGDALEVLKPTNPGAVAPRQMYTPKITVDPDATVIRPRLSDMPTVHFTNLSTAGLKEPDSDLFPEDFLDDAETDRASTDALIELRKPPPAPSRATDEEETELLSPELRARAMEMAIEDGVTELHVSYPNAKLDPKKSEEP